MRILYITADNPAVETILCGMHADSLCGLPAFYYPFKMLLDHGHTIDLLLYTPNERTVVESENFKAENLIQLHPKNGVFPEKVEYAFLLSIAVRKLLKQRNYDFVYGMTEGAHLAVQEAARRNIPCALRQYGTQEMMNVLEPIKSIFCRYLIALKNYTYITLSLYSKKSFLLATNDGSRADKLYDILNIKEKKYLYFFWCSGVYIPETLPEMDYETRDNYPKTYDPLALSMISRIADVKRQDRAAHILGELHKRGQLFHLYLVGTDDSPMMHEETVRIAKAYGVMDYIHFEGGKSQSECREYARNSFATILPCEWNRVNVFYEAMGEGAVVVTNDNHSIDDFIVPDVNCLLYEEDNFAEAAEKIIALKDDFPKYKAIRAAAHKRAKEKFMSLEKRFGMETQLVEDVAMGRDVSQYPKVL